ncbi:AraC family transcriptional regulator [Flavobacterium daejeonense]|uniref:AraC family transcriptional regulator n=1 Tax=Flavobacterium daejeonense TaxID=350893 RepID=UPI00047DDB46|nr:AraC family transcriptional regulator [Flavobacterium daejeonense]
MSTKKDSVINEYHLNKEHYDKPRFRVHNLNDYLRKHYGNTTKPHIHSFYQIIWFKKGSGIHYVDFKGYDVFENAIFLIAKNQVHYFDETIDYEGFLIHFNESFLVQNDSEVDFFLKYNLFNSPYQQPSCCVNNGVELLDEYIIQIEKELNNKIEFGKEELLRTYLKAILIQIQRRKIEVDEKDNNHIINEKRIQLIKFVNLIDENYNKGFTVAEYAQLMNISTRTLSELISKNLNKTPSQMVYERIILEAKRLLLHSDLNINQIGYRLGFDDPSYFVKFFKKHSEISPSEFRKSIS